MMTATATATHPACGQYPLTRPSTMAELPSTTSHAHLLWRPRSAMGEIGIQKLVWWVVKHVLTIKFNLRKRTILRNVIESLIGPGKVLYLLDFLQHRQFRCLEFPHNRLVKNEPSSLCCVEISYTKEPFPLSCRVILFDTPDPTRANVHGPAPAMVKCNLYRPSRRLWHCY